MKMPSVGVPCMKKSFGGVLFAFLIGLVLLRYHFSENSGKTLSPLSIVTDHTSDVLHVEEDVNLEPSESITQENKSQTDHSFPIDNKTISGLFSYKNLTHDETAIIITWKEMKKVLNRPDMLPEARGGIQEAVIAWQDVLAGIEEEKTYKLYNNGSSKNSSKEQCPFSLSPTNITYNVSKEFMLQLPCGLIQDSSITIVAIPIGLMGDFKVELTGPQFPGEPDPPIILHYNVRLQGDKITENPVIVQNTWTQTHDWGEEQRCPSDSDTATKVDGLSRCSEQIGAPVKLKNPDGNESGKAVWKSLIRKGSRENFWFPFVENYPFAATLWTGLEGFHMTVNGKHISSFEYRESLEPWLVSGVRITGDIKLVSVLANGLPSSENLDLVSDLESLKAPSLASRTKLTLFIGVFSTGNNFERRMAIRRSWMQYKAVRAGQVAVRFFVGMHKNKQVNEALWKESEMYGDVQLMPFVDYYNLITLKTIAICIYGTKIINAKYIMKTDDDAFVRVDAVLAVLNNTNIAHGLLYGRIAFESQPHRDEESKWYISPEEWSPEFYPPWAHGPGYIVSKDIAKFVVRGHQAKKLKLFKLEDVAMGIWIEEYRNSNERVQYINDDRFYNTGCDVDYIVAHYQGPRNMLCLWQKLQQNPEPTCCE